RVERQDPDRRDAEVLHIVELLDEPGEVPGPIGIAIEVGSDGNLVDDRVLVPVRIGGEQLGRSDAARLRRTRATSTRGGEALVRGNRGCSGLWTLAHTK